MNIDIASTSEAFGGKNKDGSFTLCPESFAALKKMFLEAKGSGGIQLPDHDYNLIRNLAKTIYDKQGVAFEQWT